jgi:5,10-methylenetetrahydrofolate reductase
MLHAPERRRVDRGCRFGVKLAVQMCRKLLESGTSGFYFYTLNLEASIVKVLDGLGTEPIARHCGR